MKTQHELSRYFNSSSPLLLLKDRRICILVLRQDKRLTIHRFFATIDKRDERKGINLVFSNMQCQQRFGLQRTKKLHELIDSHFITERAVGSHIRCDHKRLSICCHCVMDLMSVQTNDVTTANSNVILSGALQLVLVDLAPVGEEDELDLLFQGRTSKEQDYVE